MHNEKDEMLLHDYFDNLLSIEEQQHFEEYIVDHIELAIDLGRLKNLRRNLKNLPSNFTPPDSVTENIISSLLGSKDSIDTFASNSGPDFSESSIKEVTQKIKKKKVRKKLRPKTKHRIKQTFKYFAIIIVLISLGYGYYYYEQNDKTTPWNVKVIQESDSLQIDEKLLEINSNFETKDDQIAIIEIEHKLKLELTNNAELKVLNGTQALNSIQYISGNILFEPKYDNDIFNVVINDINLSSTNSKFSIKNESLSVSVDVISNFLTIKSNLLEYKVPLNHSFQLLGENKISIPINNKSSNYFHQLVESYTNTPSEYILEKLIEVAGLDEAFTLHSLLAHVKPNYRELIIDKLNNISPMPMSCSKEKILMLDYDGLNDWWETIFISHN
jgi:hypothetical protein